MHRLTRVFMLLCVLLALGSPSRASAQAPTLASAPAAPTQDRLVVFEAFMRST